MVGRATAGSTYAHLPPGHEPGKQSRRRTRASLPGVLLLGGFSTASLAAALGIALFGDNFKGSGQLAGTITFGVLGALMGVFAWWAWRRRRGPRPLEGVTVTVDRQELRRGERLRAKVRCADGDAPLHAALICTEIYDVEVESDESSSRQARTYELVADWMELDRSQPEHVLDLQVPADAVPSYEGDTVSWAWSVRLRQPRRMRSDPYRDVPIWVSL